VPGGCFASTVAFICRRSRLEIPQLWASIYLRLETVIFDVQAWPFLLSGEAKGSIQLQPGEQIKTIGDAFALLRQRWKPRIRHDPVPRWNERAARLADEQSPLTALQKYQQLMGEMDYLDEKVTDAAVALDEHIQQQIDQMRRR
jgi:hypothetical protein